jgi:hypothetical protein
LVDDQGYCTDVGCRYCGKVPPFTIDPSLVDPVLDEEQRYPAWMERDPTTGEVPE